MHLVFLELAKQVVNLLRFRNEIRRSDQTLPTEIGGLGDMRKQILDIQYAANIIATVLIDRYSTVVVLHNTLKDICKGAIDVKVNNILTTGHHLLGSLVAKTDDTLKNLLFILDFILVRKLKSLFQVINTQHMILRLKHFFCQDSAAQQDRRHGPKQTLKD